MLRTSLLVALLSFHTLLSGQTISLATYQYANNNRIANLEPLAHYLHEKLGYQVQVRSYPTVHAFLDGIRRNEVDIAFLNTFGYLLLEASGSPYPMRPVASLEVPATAADNYKSTLVIRKTSGISNMKQLQKSASSMRLALVNVGSTSGNLLPRLAIKKAGIDSIETSFDTVAYAMSHSNALQWILENKADISGFGYTEWLKLQQTDSLAAATLHTLWVSPEIPLGPVLFNNKFSSAMGGELLQTLLTLHQENPNALQSLKEGWSEAKQATHFEAIQSNYYDAFKKSVGRKKDLVSILSQFAF